MFTCVPSLGVGAHARRPGCVGARAAVEVDHRRYRLCRFRHRRPRNRCRSCAGRRRSALLSPRPQQLHRRRLHHRQARQRYLLAQRHPSATNPPKEWPTRCTGPPACRTTASTRRPRGRSRDRPRCAAPPCHRSPAGWWSRSGNGRSRSAITGRQAAPVLHEPGTSTTVGPGRSRRSRCGRVRRRSSPPPRSTVVVFRPPALRSDPRACGPPARRRRLRPA